MKYVPQIDLREEGMATHAGRRSAQALALRDACLGWLPFGELLARLADPFAQGWLRRSGSPFLDDISAIARTLAGRASGCCMAPTPSVARRWRTTVPMVLFCAVPSTGRFRVWARWSRSSSNAARQAT